MTPARKTTNNREIGDCRYCRRPVRLGPWGDDDYPFGYFLDGDERLGVAHFECNGGTQ